MKDFRRRSDLLSSKWNSSFASAGYSMTRVFPLVPINFIQHKQSEITMDLPVCTSYDDAEFLMFGNRAKSEENILHVHKMIRLKMRKGSFLIKKVSN